VPAEPPACLQVVCAQAGQDLLVQVGHHYAGARCSLLLSCVQLCDLTALLTVVLRGRTLSRAALLRCAVPCCFPAPAASPALCA